MGITVAATGFCTNVVGSRCCSIVPGPWLQSTFWVARRVLAIVEDLSSSTRLVPGYVRLTNVAGPDFANIEVWSLDARFRPGAIDSRSGSIALSTSP